MPLYEYKCNSCGKTFEVIQRFSDEPLTIHEGCGGVTERLISAPAFHLKGSGWYATDYAKGSGSASRPGEAKSDSKTAESNSSESGSGKSESKETKTDSGTSSDSRASESKPSPAPAADSK
jgi:putative FmdB family regulatory protein